MSNSTAKKEKQDWLIGRVLGKYRLEKLIGSGAFASIYEAVHTNLNVPFAIKVLHMAFVNHEEVVKRFFREAQAASQLQHENVVFIADVDIEDGVGPYMVMEYLQGDTIKAHLDRKGPFTLDRVGEISRQICRSLGLAHRKGVIHRDLKPENIFLIQREMGRELVKILDFGIAHLTEASESITGARLMGTPVYMAPEQFRGVVNSPSLDIYSFGVILYEMLTGKPPFQGQNVQQLGIEHLLTPAPELDDRFSHSLRQLQARMLAKTPEERPSTMEEVWSLLAPALDPDRVYAHWHQEQHFLSGTVPAVSMGMLDNIVPGQDSGRRANRPPANSQVGDTLRIDLSGDKKKADGKKSSDPALDTITPEDSSKRDTLTPEKPAKMVLSESATSLSKSGKDVLDSSESFPLALDDEIMPMSLDDEVLPQKTTKQQGKKSEESSEFELVIHSMDDGVWGDDKTSSAEDDDEDDVDDVEEAATLMVPAPEVALSFQSDTVREQGSTQPLQAGAGGASSRPFPMPPMIGGPGAGAAPSMPLPHQSDFLQSSGGLGLLEQEEKTAVSRRPTAPQDFFSGLPANGAGTHSALRDDENTEPFRRAPENIPFPNVGGETALSEDDEIEEIPVEPDEDEGSLNFSTSPTASNPVPDVVADKKSSAPGQKRTSALPPRGLPPVMPDRASTPPGSRPSGMDAVIRQSVHVRRSVKRKLGGKLGRMSQKEKIILMVAWFGALLAVIGVAFLISAEVSKTKKKPSEEKSRLLKKKGSKVAGSFQWDDGKKKKVKQLPKIPEIRNP